MYCFVRATTVFFGPIIIGEGIGIEIGNLVVSVACYGGDKLFSNNRRRLFSDLVARLYVDKQWYRESG